MNLDELKARGGIVETSLVKRSVTWVRKDDDGSEESIVFDIFVKRMSFGIIEQVQRGEIDSKSRSATMISEGVRLGDSGEELISYDDAYALESTLAIAILNEFFEVNKLKKDREKN